MVLKSVDDIENDQLNVLEIVVSHRVNEHIEDNTLCRPDVDPTVIERPVVRHITNDFIDNGTMSSFPSDFEETDQMFLKFGEELKTAGGSSSVGDNSRVTAIDVSKSTATMNKHVPTYHTIGGMYGRLALSLRSLHESCISGYSKGLGWGPKSKSCKTASASSFSTMFSQAREYELQQVMVKQQRVELDEAKRAIEE
ncbi:cytochrome P450 CYP82D47-like [Cucumis melo var. makuwa]|uniref:Cytochrome P450 CYP82D47-like n=1 Tax=Cucumis melo var. makuwa TaxID=1194695 RepID=A0A5A7USW7_CUCMM|nr:cytochrome P450 CYP82D47-like [Cucumis melo var. makuwa]TYK24288.1 cytochrome P450 CYP82D47-like [Cucumis melo var. makuwa]